MVSTCVVQGESRFQRFSRWEEVHWLPGPARSGFLPRFSANRGFERRAARENTARLELLRASCLGDAPPGLLLHAAHCRGAPRVAGERLLLLGSVLPTKTNLL